MICTACKHDIHPWYEINDKGGFVRKCPRQDCGAPIVNEPTAHAPVSQRAKPTPVEKLGRAARAIGMPAGEMAAKLDNLFGARTIIAATEDRIEEIDRELKRLDELKLERDQLQRMLDAAKPPAPTIKLAKADHA